jgi:2-oxoglutarate ferredoxin oxidoreductase subunit alpha
MSTVVNPVETSPARDGAEPTHPSVNDLVIRVGTVNGSGSQSANLVLLRALHLMGIPCSGKNVFPSNIEGLPTWFHIRASGKGYVAHRLDSPVLVCMNADTAADDVRQLRPGAVCIYRDDIYDDRKHQDKVPLPTLRDDVTFLSAPFQDLVKEAYPPDPKDKGYGDKVRKVINMVYVGVVARACDIEMDAVREATRRVFPGKAKAAAINIKAAEAGYDWAEANLPRDLPFKVRRMDGTRHQILIEGNKAAALGSLFGGVSVLTWYPITPSSSLAEYAEEFLKKYRTGPDGKSSFAVVQAEDELAAVGMAIGAGWAGARTLTATSGPGISLMSEFVGLSYFAEIPVVIIDVQRMGPSTGLPTRTNQGDVFKLHVVGHGDCRHIVLIPGSVGECYSMTVEALDLSQEYQCPVFVATDLDLGMNLWLTDPFEYPAGPIRRGKVLDAAQLEEHLQKFGSFGRYRDVDGDGVCYRTLPGTEHDKSAYFTRGTGHNESSGYSERPEDWKRNIDRLARKLESARAKLPAPVIEADPKARIGLIAYGSTQPAMVEARDLLREQGVPTAYLRLRALPASDEVAAFVAKYDRVYVVEQNRDGQVCALLRSTLAGHLDDLLVSVTHYNGTPIAAENIVKPVLDWERTFLDNAPHTGNGHAPESAHVDEPSSE